MRTTKKNIWSDKKRQRYLIVSIFLSLSNEKNPRKKWILKNKIVIGFVVHKHMLNTHFNAINVYAWAFFSNIVVSDVNGMCADDLTTIRLLLFCCCWLLPFIRAKCRISSGYHFPHYMISPWKPVRDHKKKRVTPNNNSRRFNFSFNLTYLSFATYVNLPNMFVRNSANKPQSVGPSTRLSLSLPLSFIRIDHLHAQIKIIEMPRFQINWHMSNVFNLLKF